MIRYLMKINILTIKFNKLIKINQMSFIKQKILKMKMIFLFNLMIKIYKKIKKIHLVNKKQ